MEWISVEENLPPSDQEVLVCMRNRFTVISYHYQDSLGIHWSSQEEGWDNVYDGLVTHWMTLPKPPTLSNSVQ